jgi:hypothetical protein
MVGGERGMGHVVLLGDSAFDNGAYVGGVYSEDADYANPIEPLVQGGARPTLPTVRRRILERFRSALNYCPRCGA